MTEPAVPNALPPPPSTNDPITIPPVPESSSRSVRRPTQPIECGFCGCHLAAESGDVLRRGADAAKYVDLDLKLDRYRENEGILQQQVTTLTTKLNDANRKIADLEKRLNRPFGF